MSAEARELLLAILESMRTPARAITVEQLRAAVNGERTALYAFREFTSAAALDALARRRRRARQTHRHKRR